LDEISARLTNILSVTGYFKIRGTQRCQDTYLFGMYTIFSFVDNVHDGTMCPGVDSASRNEYQGFLLG